MLKLKVQIFCEAEIAMGPGKADLLDAIRDYGSISSAGKAMGMSYRRSWQLVDVMNRCWREPLVETAPGSARHGGGARITAFGETVLAQYRALQARVIDAAASPDFGPLSEAMLASPRPSQKD